MKEFVHLMIFIVICMAATDSFAGRFNINPVIGTLGESKRIDSLTLKNESNELATIQIKLYAWQQNEAGEDDLKPSEELSYMPRIFQIKPGEERSIRVGYSNKKTVSVEKAYRLYLTEQPQATTDPNDKGQLKVALRMGLPIFVTPKDAVRDKGTLENAVIAKGKVLYNVSNSGNSRLVMKKVVLATFDVAGKELSSKDLGRQFVLAGNKRHFAIPITREECSKAAMFSITGELETGGVLKGSGRIEPGSCTE